MNGLMEILPEAERARVEGNRKFALKALGEDRG